MIMEPQQNPSNIPLPPMPEQEPVLEPAQNPTPDNTNNVKSKNIKSILSTLSLLLLAPFLALFITAHVFQPYQVDGQSMETTLQDGDRLIVYKLPVTLSNIMNNNYTPGRWDVIVFDKPKQLSAPDSTKHLIKRVIGLPGERVVVSEGIVIGDNRDNSSDSRIFGSITTDLVVGRATSRFLPVNDMKKL